MFYNIIRIIKANITPHKRIRMLGSLANGVTEVSGFLQGEDALATLKAFQAMGVKIERQNDKVS
jgi:3-phosphoshikimate 1-carboxyvinyltransferase